MKIEPIYTPENCDFAYQLRWSLALFPDRMLPAPELWLSELQSAMERDQIRILEFNTLRNGTVLFLLSTRPDMSPPHIVKSTKGRLLHQLRSIQPIEFRRNFRLTSIGAANISTVEAYISTQIEHHPLADESTQHLLRSLSFVQEDVDLAKPTNSAHGQYAIALHIVLVHAERWRTANERFLTTTRDMIVRCANRKQHQLSAISLLPDHVHFTIAVGYDASPQDLVLSYMNNVAFKHDMTRVWMNSFYVGTIGPYDMNAVRPSRV